MKVNDVAIAKLRQLPESLANNTQSDLLIYQRRDVACNVSTEFDTFFN